jgi:hypothetical protein
MKYTREFYDNLQTAYDYFNEKLFENELPQAFMVCNRKKGAFGYYRPESFLNSDQEKIDEIGVNPDCLYMPIKELLATLAHEMTHKWTTLKGHKSRRGFHCKAWGEKMVSFDLQPVDAVTKQDALTGFKMCDRIIEGGIFDLTCDELLKIIKFDLTNVPEEKEKKKRNSNRVKYQCPICGEKVSGKKDIIVKCGNEECEDAVMEVVE